MFVSLNPELGYSHHVNPMCTAVGVFPPPVAVVSCYFCTSLHKHTEIQENVRQGPHA